jgi:PAS domain S-box-containing protein
LIDNLIVSKALQAGAQDYLVKSNLNGEQLVKTIFNAIDRNQMIMEMESLAKKLHVNEERFRKIIDKSGDGIVIANKDGIIGFVNPAAEKLFKKKKPKLIGQYFDFPKNDGESTEIKISNLDGSTTIGEMLVVEIEWEEDTAYLLSIRDITARKKAKLEMQRLSQTLHEMNALIEDAPQPIILSHPNGKILRVNEETKKLTLYSIEELLNCTILNLFDSESQEIVENHYFADIYDPLVSNKVEASIKTKNGGTINVEVTSIVLNISKNKIIQSFFSNITERKSFEINKQLLIDQLIGSLEFKSKFLATMSHELRTPLNSIIGFSELLLEDEVGDLNEDQLEYVLDILSSGTHLLTLIDAILDISKFEAGKFELKHKKLKLSNLINEINVVVKSLIVNNKLEYNVVGINEEESITVDPMRFKQILFNLISNAIKFTNNGSITLRCIQRIDHWEFQIIDTGIGIAKKDYDVVFREFGRVENDKTREIPGTGLGLALTKRLVNLHEGEIWFKTEVGKGTTFFFTIPKTLSKEMGE